MIDSSAKKILIFVTAFFWFSLYACVPTLAIYAKSLGASYDMVGLIIGSYGFTQLILRIPIGVISDAWGIRAIFIILGLALSAVSGFGMWLFPFTIAMLIFRALQGVSASTWVDFTVLYASYFPHKEAPRAIGFISSINNFGQVTAMLAGGFIAQHLGLAAPFILSGIAGIIGLSLSLFVKENRSEHKKIPIKALTATMHDTNLIRLSVLAILLQVVSFVTVFGFLPLAGKALGASNIEIGLLTSITMIPSIFSSALSGSFFAKHFGDRAMLVSGLFILAASCILIPFIHSLHILFVTQAIGGFARGLVLPLLMGLSIKHFPGEKRSTAMGVFQAIYSLGMFGGPVLAGFLSSRFGLSTGFVITGLIGLIGAFLALSRKYLPLDGQTKA